MLYYSLFQLFLFKHSAQYMIKMYELIKTQDY